MTGHPVTGPLAMRPPTDAAPRKFTDVDTRVADTLDVTPQPTYIAFNVVGPKGGHKSAVWLSHDAARELAAYLVAATTPQPTSPSKPPAKAAQRLKVKK